MENLFIIDGHEDLSYESLLGRFDYRLSVAETRRRNHGPETFEPTIGWPEMQKGQYGIIFSTIFTAPPLHSNANNVAGVTSWQTPLDFHTAVMRHMDFYEKWQNDNPDMFRLIWDRKDYDAIISDWKDDKAEYPENTHPVGLFYLMEGAEGLRSFEDLDLYRERGLRMIGPVWGGGRWCGGTMDGGKDELTTDGRHLLDHMAAKGYILDISHMRNHSALDSLDYYQGIVAASHANCNALLQGLPYERHLNDETIRRLAERGGVMGVLPFNAFLKADWEGHDWPRSAVTLNTLADHIDHICQLCGSSENVGIGSDADGGFGYPNIPEEMNDISDLQKLSLILQNRGFSDADIARIFHGNWQRILERALS